ncbi:hypothetical protein SAMN05421749_102369 [Acinetobacter marinus]|uniref:Nucleotidyltransferase domain-containing protein n=1 Tax=Acinetobacter marinus TaxID=281375 RepID=A0A1G6HL29_9GAMM|nr:hypothetical protein SAMN05421749_102369 [Acinetobacter marinus]
MFEITNLLNQVQILKIDCSIYLFGSYLYSETWADLDALIIYKDYEDVSIIKNVFSKSFLNTPLDLIFMTKEEEIFFNFINRTNARKIFPKNTY